MLRDVGGAAEEQYHVGGWIDGRERPVHGLAQQLGNLRVIHGHRDDVVAVLFEVGRNRKGRGERLGGLDADDRNAMCVLEDARNPGAIVDQALTLSSFMER
jgi:hypothetical protein